MREDSPWEMEMCEYCFERMHRSQIDEHKSLVHADVMRAEEVLHGMTKRESRAFWAILGWMMLQAVLVFLGYVLGIEESLYYYAIIAGMFAFPVLLGFYVHFTTPVGDKEMKKKAWDTYLNRPVKCDICEKNISFNDYYDHMKKTHPKQVPYEWFRVATMIVLCTIGVGGYIVLSIVAEGELLSFEQTAALAAGWIMALCILCVWIFYLQQVGEPKHIKKMQREWEEHRFDPSAEKRQ